MNVDCKKISDTIKKFENADMKKTVFIDICITAKSLDLYNERDKIIRKYLVLEYNARLIRETVEKEYRFFITLRNNYVILVRDIACIPYQPMIDDSVYSSIML